MALKQCKECGKDVGGKVSKCPHCGTDQRNWAGRHPILTAIIGLIILGGVMNAINPNKSSVNSVANNSDVTQAVNNVVDDNADTINKSEFNQLKTGMSYEQAVNIIGNPGELTSESEMAGYKTSMYTWKGHGGFGANANAMFQNNKLINKAQIGLE